ncbi:MAG: NAD(P)H-hydrate epimerase [Candidatus Omnitrophota bacterium]
MKSITVQEMKDLDRRAIGYFGIPSIVLMENAGRCVSAVTEQLLGMALGKKIAIFCGTGNNGGDGFVAARCLKQAGADVKVYIVGERYKIEGDSSLNLSILEKLGVMTTEISSSIVLRGDLVIDSIFGIGLIGEVKEPAKSIIESFNKLKIPIISVDVPSGLDADTGEILGVAVRATKTVTMQFPKKGFYINNGPVHTGEVVVVDIGIPG